MSDERNFEAHDHDHDEEEMNSLILTDENGEDVEFDCLDTIEYEGAVYFILLPVEDTADGGVVIMRLEEGETEEDDALVTVTDEEEDLLDAVYEIFKEKNKDFFEFDD